MKKISLRLYLLAILCICVFVLYLRNGPLPLHWELQRFAYDNELSGMLTVIAYPDGRTEYVNSIHFSKRGDKGCISNNELSPIASLSKPITAMTIRWLINQEKLSLTDRLVTLLPELDYTADKRFNDITVQHLLQHEAGFDRTVSGEIIEDQTRHFIPCKQAINRALMAGLDYSPGSNSKYANVGYCFLGMIIESITHDNYETAVRNMLAERKVSNIKLSLGPPNEAAWDSVFYNKAKELQNIGPVGGWFADLSTLLEIFELEKHDHTISMAPSYSPSRHDYYGLGWRVWQEDNLQKTLTHFGALPKTENYSFAMILPNGGIVVSFICGDIDNYAIKFMTLKNILAHKLSS